MTVALIASFDALEEADGERIGAPFDEVTAVLRSLEARILAMPADTSGALAWKVRRLARAIENNWRASEVRAITDAITRDVESSDA